jgi:hypothetical protein
VKVLSRVFDDWIRRGLDLGAGDGDGIADDFDNCRYHANLDQRCSDADGVGSICDADLNNDGLVNLSIFRVSGDATGGRIQMRTLERRWNPTRSTSRQ